MTAAAPIVAKEPLRAAFGEFVTGVTIVTAANPAGGYLGVTCNSFSSVSLEPALVSWALSLRSTSIDGFRSASHFAVHILAADQVALSTRFARSSTNKFENLTFALGAGGVPLFDGVAAYFECRNERQLEGGDHIIFLGQVLRFWKSGRSPLIFHRGQYASLPVA